MHNFKISEGIKIVDVEENDDGTAKIIIDLSPEFEKWFCETYHLESFDKAQFDEWFYEALEKGLALAKEVHP